MRKSIRIPRSLIALAAITALIVGTAGCESLRRDTGKPAPPPPSDPEAQQLMEIVAYYHTAERLSPEAASRRFDQLAGAREMPGCTVARLRSAMLMTQLPANAVTADHQTVLAPCLADGPVGASARGALAGLLARTLGWRDHSVNADSGNDALKSEIGTLRKENAQLRKQLEELKAIEESLQRRNSTEE